LGVPYRIGYYSLLLKQAFLNRKARRSPIIPTPQRNADRVPAGLAASDATPATLPPMQRHFRSIQGVSDPSAGVLASHVDIVALRMVNKSEVNQLQTNPS
jgi:hypothetical protein